MPLRRVLRVQPLRVHSLDFQHDWVTAVTKLLFLEPTIITTIHEQLYDVLGDLFCTDV